MVTGRNMIYFSVTSANSRKVKRLFNPTFPFHSFVGINQVIKNEMRKSSLGGFRDGS